MSVDLKRKKEPGLLGYKTLQIMKPGAKLYQPPLLKKDLLYNGVSGVILL